MVLSWASLGGEERRCLLRFGRARWSPGNANWWRSRSGSDRCSAGPKHGRPLELFSTACCRGSRAKQAGSWLSRPGLSGPTACSRCWGAATGTRTLCVIASALPGISDQPGVLRFIEVLEPGRKESQQFQNVVRDIFGLEASELASLGAKRFHGKPPLIGLGVPRRSGGGKVQTFAIIRFLFGRALSETKGKAAFWPGPLTRRERGAPPHNCPVFAPKWD